MVLVAGSMAAMSAQAAGFYMEGGIMQSSFSGVSQSELDAAMIEVGEDTFASFTLNDSSLDKSDMGFAFSLGYQFTPHLAVEAAYVQLGKSRYEADVTVDDGGGSVDLTTGFDFKSSGPAVALVGTWPLNESISLDARAGAYFSRTRVTVFASDGTSTESESMGSEKDTSVLLGVGATWAMLPNLGLRLGYTRFDQALAGEGDAGSLSLGLRVTF
jgi:hypothetical protein